MTRLFDTDITADADVQLNAALEPRDIALLQILNRHFLSDAQVRAAALWWWREREDGQSLFDYLCGQEVVRRTARSALDAAADDPDAFDAAKLLTPNGLAILLDEAGEAEPPVPARDTGTFRLRAPTVPVIGRDFRLPEPGARLGECLVTEAVGQRGDYVFRALHLGLGAPVVVRVLPPAFADLPPADRDAVRELFLDVAALAHPSLVAVIDFVEVAPTPHLVLEFVEGISLRELIRQSGRLVAERCVRLVSQVADALAAAHGAGVAHGLLRPTNMLVTRDGHAKLADVGLLGVRSLGGDLRPEPAYVAPDAGPDPTAADDVFALGVTLHEGLTGHLPDPARRSLIPGPRGPEMSALGELVQRMLDPYAARRPDLDAARTELSRIEAALAARSAPAGPPPAGTGSSSVPLGREPPPPPPAPGPSWGQLAQRFGADPGRPR